MKAYSSRHSQPLRHVYRIARIKFFDLKVQSDKSITDAAKISIISEHSKFFETIFNKMC